MISGRKKLPVYIFQGLLIGTPLILSIIFAFSMYILYNRLLVSTESLIEKGRREIVQKETEVREELFRKIFLSVYSELWKNFPEYEKTLLEKNIYSAKEFLKRNSIDGLPYYRVMYGSGIVCYVDLKTGRIHHPHYARQPVNVSEVRDDKGKLFILEGVERARQEGNAFVEYRIQGKNKLAYFEYLPNREIVLITYGSGEELKKNYRYIVKSIMMNMVKAVSQTTPLVLEELEGNSSKIVISTFNYGNENLPSFEIHFPEIKWKLRIYIDVPQLRGLVFMITSKNEEIMRDTAFSLFEANFAIFLVIAVLAIFLGFWLIKEFDSLSLSIIRMNMEDRVTGGYNQYGLRIRFERLHELGFKRAVVVFLDIENFKVFNKDRKRGDKFLRKVYNFLRENLTEKFPGVIIGRQEADRFIIVIPVEDSEDELEVIQFLQSFLVSENSQTEKTNFYTVVDIVDIEGTDFNNVVNVLYEALKRIKQEKRYFLILDDDLRKKMESDEKLYLDFRKALEEDRITFAIQPIVDVNSLSPVGYEVLSRIIINGKAASIYPYITCPTIKDGILQIEMTKRIIEKALTYKVANSEEFQGRYFSINVSKAFILSGFYDFITDLIERLRYPVEELVVEVLERDSYSKETIDVLNRIKERGIKIAIDDFGIERANVMNLLQLPVDIVKFEGELLKAALFDEKARKLLKGLNETILSIGNKTVIEMVEDKEMLELSKKLGFSFVQGYAVGKPEIPERNY